MTEAEANEAMVADLLRSRLEPKHLWAKLVGADTMQRIFPTAKTKVEWAYSIPYHDAHRRGQPPIGRYRVLSTLPGAFGEVEEKPAKYLQPPNTAPGAYFFSAHQWDSILSNVSEELVIVEGEKKAARGCLDGFHVIGIGGVWSWKTKSRGMSLLPELDAIAWEGRHVYLSFDSDTRLNSNVAHALLKLTEMLTGRGALVHEATIPEITSGEKAGLDDFLIARGSDAYRAMLDEAKLRVGEIVTQLWKMNLQYAVISMPCAILSENWKEDTGVGCALFTEKSLGLSLRNRQVRELKGKDAKEVETQILDKWLKWPARRSFERLTYCPGESHVVDGGRAYNTWYPSGIEPKKGSIQPWKDLIKYLFEDAEEAHIHWFEQWLGFPLKNPGVKMDSLIGMFGTQGTGKSLIPLRTIGPLYGRNFVSVDQSAIESDFNDWAVGRQFILIDEIEPEGRLHRSGKMKKLTTEKNLLVNRKGLERYEVPARANFYLVSNKANAFSLDEDDRRHFIHRVDKPRMSPEFSEEYCDKWLGYDEKQYRYFGVGHAALLHYFLYELDYTGFDHRVAPMTDAKRDMIVFSRADADNWIRTFTEGPMWQKYQCREVWTAGELCDLYRASGPRQAADMVAPRFGTHLTTVGCPKWYGTCGGVNIRLVAVTNFDKWKAASPAEWMSEYNRCKVPGLKCV